MASGKDYRSVPAIAFHRAPVPHTPTPVARFNLLKNNLRATTFHLSLVIDIYIYIVSRCFSSLIKLFDSVVENKRITTKRGSKSSKVLERWSRKKAAKSEKNFAQESERGEVYSSLSSVNENSIGYHFSIYIYVDCTRLKTIVLSYSL